MALGHPNVGSPNHPAQLLLSAVLGPQPYPQGFGDVALGFGGAGGEVRVCYGVHCFRLICIILALVCALGSLFHVLVALRTRDLYASLRLDPDPDCGDTQAQGEDGAGSP